MERDKKLSAARKKLQEYKLSKGAIPPGVGTTVHSIDETAPPTEAPTNGQSSYTVQEAFQFQYPPPPRSTSSQEGASVGDNQKVEEVHSGYPAAPMIPPIQTSGEVNYSAAGLFDTSSDNQEGSTGFAEMKTNGFDAGVVNQEGSSNAEQTSFLPSPTASPQPTNTFVPTPSAPPLASELFKANQPQGRFTDAGQDFPVNFFQPIPVAQQYQPVSFNSNLFQQPNSSPQDFIYNSPQTPLFFNVDGSNNAPLSPPPLTDYPQQEPSNPIDSYTNSVAVAATEDGNLERLTVESSSGGVNVNACENTEDVETGQTFQQSTQVETETNGLHVPLEAEKPPAISSPFEIQSRIPSSPILREPPLRTPTPSSRKLSEASQDEKDRQEIQLLQRMQSVQDALELQLEELRRDNKRLSDRKSELTSQLENCEKNIQELRRERDRAREDAKKLVQPLHAKINALYEENQKILKNSSDVGMELRMKLQDKSKQYEDMEQAFIVVTTSKMDLAAELDQEKERAKELEITVAKQAEEIAILRSSNFKLEERVKVDQQKDAILHQMEDQRRHFQVQTETLQQELAIVRDKLRKSSVGSPSIETALSPYMSVSQTAASQQDGHSCDSHGPNHQHPHVPEIEGHSPSHPHEHPHKAVKAHDSSESHQHCHGQDDHGHSHGHDHSHDHGHGHDHSHDHGHGHDHSHDHGHGHDHSHDHGHGHDHSHDHGHGHAHSHDHCHGHDHSHDHGHDHSHDQSHDHGHDHSHDHNQAHTKHTLPPEQSKNPLEEMKRRLHHLEWENSTFRSDVDKLATEAKDKKQYEAKCIKLQEECDKLREECRRLESLVIQLQGENDTIGDYIALYQSQRLALKESAKEKDVQLENLAKEREVLVSKMGELTQLLRELKGPSAGDGAVEANQAGHVCLGHHNHAPSSEPGTQPSKEIEGKIMNLLTEISSSSLIENFHPCAVCSGRLMNV